MPSKSSKQTYKEMVAAAIGALKKRGGSSRQAISKYILANFDVNLTTFRSALRLALRKGAADGTFVQNKQSFKLGKPEPKPKKKAAPKKKKAAPKKKKTTKKKVRVGNFNSFV